MKRKHIFFGIIPLVFISLTVFLGGMCDQPPTTCQVGRGEFAALFKKTSGDDDCYTNAIGMPVKGDAIGFQTYFHANAEGRPDYEDAIFAMKTETVGLLVLTAGDTDIKPYSSGDFDTAFPSNDICTVGDVDDVEVKLDAVIVQDTNGDDVVIQDEQDRVLKWEDIQVLVSTAYTGTQVRATLKYEDNILGCKAEYDVWAVMPMVYCADEDGEPDDDYCSPVALPPKTTTGSGISPDFPIKCDKDLLFCVLEEAPPAFK